MKKIFNVLLVRVIGIIAIVAVIGFTMSCGGDDDTTEGIAPIITTASLPNGVVNTVYSKTLEATGDTPITWSIDGTLPAGLNLATTGIISGIPTAAGTSTFTVKATNSAGNNTKSLSITVATASMEPPLTGDNPFKGTWEYADDRHTVTMIFGDTSFELIYESIFTDDMDKYYKQEFKGTYTFTSDTSTITSTEARYKESDGDWEDDPEGIGEFTITLSSNGKIILPQGEEEDLTLTKTN